MIKPAHVEALRQNLEAALNEKYKDYPNTPATHRLIQLDIWRIQQLFPELDIVAAVGNDLAPDDSIREDQDERAISEGHC